MSEVELKEHHGCHCDSCVNVIWTELVDLREMYSRLEEENTALLWELGELKSKLKFGEITEGT